MKANDFLKRYQKQISLPQIEEAGQLKLTKSHVVIIGVGGLGSIAAAYLAGAGVGFITLIDPDYPDLSNLHRQVFFDASDSRSKAEQLKTHINKLNNLITVEVYTEAVNKSNILRFIGKSDIVLDCTDDLYAKYLINDACVLNNKAFVYASIHQVEGYAFVYNPKSNSANLRDFFPKISEAVIPTCSDAGVYNILAGMFGLIQANEAMKLLLNLDERLENRMMICNVLDYKQQFIQCANNNELDVQAIWEKENYTAKTNATLQEIEACKLKALIETDKNLKTISLLEDWEEEDTIGNATRLALSDFNDWDFKFDTEHSYLVYCQTGKRSKLICSKLQEKYSAITFYTLIGGREALEEIEI